MMRPSFHTAAAALALGLALAGCVSEPTRLPAGVSRAEALQCLGAPSADYALPAGGERLQYSRQPSGFEVSNVDLDPSGRVVSVRQELNENLFGATIRPDVWRAADVLRTYGRPAEITRVTSFDGTVWSWHYLMLNSPRLLYIYLDPQGVVRRYHVGDDLRRDRVRW